jgi:hypothetical protein
MAKTAFGYSANEVLEQARQPRSALGIAPTAAFHPPRATPGPAPMGPPAPMPGLPPMPPPRSHAPSAPPPMSSPALQPTMLPPPPPPQMQPPMAPPPQPYSPGPPGGYMPQSAANAKTMFVQGPGPAPMPAPQPYAPPSAMAATLVPPPVQQIAVPVSPAGGRPMMAIPAAQPPPYFASQTASRVIRPIEPWRDGLRAWMFLGGLGLIAAFVTPLTTSPLSFAWRQVLDGAGTARLPPLTIAAVGLLSVVLAIVPMPALARGLLAALLAIAGIAVPIALVGLPPWQALAPMIGTLILVPSLLVRAEYRDAMTARLLITLGAIGILLPFSVPQGGAIPLVSVFKALIDLPGQAKIEPALIIGLITIVVISLLAWLPAPVTGGAKVWAWLLILWALIVHVIHLVLAGGIGGAITGAPGPTLLGWVAGGHAGLGAAYLVIAGYGLATVIGKQLE